MLEVGTLSVNFTPATGQVHVQDIGDDRLSSGLGDERRADGGERQLGREKRTDLGLSEDKRRWQLLGMSGGSIGDAHALGPVFRVVDARMLSSTERARSMSSELL